MRSADEQVTVQEEENLEEGEAQARLLGKPWVWLLLGWLETISST